MNHASQPKNACAYRNKPRKLAVASDPRRHRRYAKGRMTDNQEGRTVPIVWVGLEDVPVRSVTNVISQYHGDLFIVNLGFVNPPILIGSQEEIRDQAEDLTAVSVTPVARLGLTVGGMESLIDTLQENLKRYRQSQKGKESE